MGGVAGGVAGVLKGYIDGRMYRDTNDRAERTLGIHEAREARSQLEADRITAAMEHFQTRATRDGAGGSQKEEIWDYLADDPKYDALRTMGKQGNLPNSPASTNPDDAFHQGVLDRGMTENDVLPGGEGALSAPEPTMDGPPAQAGPGGGGGGPALQGAPAGGNTAIPLAPQQETSNVEATPWNRIGRNARAAEGGPVVVGDKARPAYMAAEGGPVSTGGPVMGGQYKLWEPKGGGFAAPQQSPVMDGAAAPGGSPSWMDRLKGNRQSFSDTGINSGYAPPEAFYNPGDTTTSQNSGSAALRGAYQGGNQQIPMGGNDGLPAGQMPMQQLQASPWAQAAEGGPVQVPAEQQQQPPPQGAIPTQAVQPQPQQSPAPQWSPQNEYRTRLAAWQHEGENMWMMAGGLEGVQKFREMGDATARKEIMGYGLQAVEMMDQGNVGEAMRAANSAMEATPFDTGLKFIAKEGKLHMVGEDGVPGVALKANDVRAYMENHLKTPANYLEWKKQVETERSGRAGEKQRQGELDLGRDQFDLDKKYRGAETDAKTLTALAAYEGSQAQLARRTQAAMDAAEGGWSAGNVQTIQKDTQAWVLDNFDPLHEDIEEHFKGDKLAWEDFKIDVEALQLYNPWNESTQTGSIPRPMASIISQLIRQPGGVAEEDLGLEEGDFKIREHPSAPGELIVNYKGQLVALPKVMHADAKKNSAYLETPADGGGSKQSPAGGGPDPAQSTQAALPVDDNMGPPSPPPAGSPELAPEDQDAGYKYIQLQSGGWALSNQQGDPVKSLAPPEKRVNPYEGMSDAQIMGQRRG